MKQALILFTRIPVPGKTKTRLMPYFSPKQCAKLHTCFLKDISEQCRKVKADCFVCYAPEDGDVKHHSSVCILQACEDHSGRKSHRTHESSSKSYLWP